MAVTTKELPWGLWLNSGEYTTQGGEGWVYPAGSSKCQRHEAGSGDGSVAVTTKEPPWGLWLNSGKYTTQGGEGCG